MTDTIHNSSDTMLLGDSDLPLHERLANALETAIGSGRYPPGTRLPTHRQLAQQFSVSIGSVTRAIDSLSVRGVVRGEIGRGTFVLEGGQDDGGMVDLTINAPPPLIAPASMLAASEMANRHALALAHGGYVDPSGTPRQRAVMAGWISRTRTAMGPDDILLVNGAQQGLHLAFAVLKAQSDTILTETASFPGALAAAANLGMAMVAVAVDEEGMLPAALDTALRRTGARIIYTTPVCQNPLGFETGPARRRELADIALQYGATIVEDDIYGIYAAKGRLTYRELAPDHTIYVTALSKSVTPLIRAGLIAPPPALMGAVRKRLRAESWGLPPYIGEMAAAIIETGLADVTAAAIRSEALARQQLAQQVLQIKVLPMPQGAPHIWLPMAPLRAEQFARRASEAGVRITPPTATQVGDAPVGGVRLCIMAPPSRAPLARALKILAGLLDSDEDVVV